MRITSGLAVIALVASTLAAGYDIVRAQSSRTAESELKAAQHTAEALGDLPNAIKQYQSIVDKYAKSDRATAATALTAMAECYRKLGNAQARALYEQVVRDYADQSSAVARARLGLLALQPALEAGAGAAGVSDQLMFSSQMNLDVADVSGDGRFLVLSEPWQLRDWRTGESVKIPHTSGSEPHLSPDQRRVAYVRWEQGWQLTIAAPDGSSARVLAEGPIDRPMDIADWSPDGTRLLAMEGPLRSQPDLCVVSIADGSIRHLGVQVTGRFGNGKWSPDGRYVLYDNEGLFVLSVDGASNVQVAEPQPGTLYYPFWSPDGRRVLYVSNRAGATDLLSIEIKDGKPVGAAALVKADIGALRPIRAASDGTVYWTKRIVRSDVFAVELDQKTGQPTSAALGLHQHGGALGSGPLAWSPDGRSLAFMRRVAGSADRIVIRSLQTGEERDVPDDPSRPAVLRYADLHWLPDGSLLATAWDPAPQLRVDTIDSLTGQRRTVMPAVLVNGYSWPKVAPSADGRSWFYSLQDKVNAAWSVDLRLVRHDMGGAGDKDVYRYTSTGSGFFSLSASPDERHLAFAVFPTKGNGTCPLLSLNLEDMTTRTLTTELGNGNIAGTAWTPDGKFVYAVTDPGNGKPADILVIPAEGGTPRALGVNVPAISALKASRDGRRLAFTSSESNVEVWMTRNLLPKAATPAAKVK